MEADTQIETVTVEATRLPDWFLIALVIGATYVLEGGKTEFLV